MQTKKLLPTFLALLGLVLVATTAQAQYDDMYYNPDDFRSSEFRADDSDYYSNDEEFYEDDRAGNYDYDDDYYDYYYSSRIRRFRRPYYGFGYYDPVYVDVAYYDPFFRPAGTTVLIYNNNFGFRRRGFFRPAWGWSPYAGVNRFGWNRWNRGFNTWGNPYGFGAFNRPAFAGAGWGAPVGAFGGGYYCPPAWGGGNTYVVPNSVANVTNRTVVRTPRANTTSIADRINRTRAVTPDTKVTGAKRANSRTGTRSTRDYGNTRTSRTGAATRGTVTPRNTTRSGATRGTTTRPNTVRPSGGTNRSARQATPSRSNRSYAPTRSSRTVTPQRSTRSTRSYTPSRSTRRYTPSRSTRSASPSRSSSRSTSPSRSRSSGGSSRGGSRGGK